MNDPNIKHWIYEKLEEKYKSGKTIQDFFLIAPSPRNKSTGAVEELELDIEIPPNILWPQFPGGSLKVFLADGCKKITLCERSKFNFPKISTPKTAAGRKIKVHSVTIKGI
jgi:hypothetical protein